MNELFKDYPDIVNVQQISEMLHVSTPLVYRLLQDGTIPAKKVGTKYIIAKKSVIEFLLLGEEL